MIRFWSKVEKTDTCWLWTASKNHNGYGIFDINGKTQRAHRLSYELYKGKIPDGLQIDHINRDKTDNRLENLRWLSKRDNSCNTIRSINRRGYINKRGYKIKDGSMKYYYEFEYMLPNEYGSKNRKTKSFKTLEEAQEFKKRIKNSFSKKI